MVDVASCCCRAANSSGVSSGSTSEKLKTGGSSPTSIIQTPCSSSSESCDNSKSSSTLVVGGNSGALSFLVGSSSIWMVSVVVASAVVDTGFGTIVAVGRGDDVTLGSCAGNSVPSKSCKDTLTISGGFFAGAAAFPLPTYADRPLEGSGC